MKPEENSEFRYETQTGMRIPMDLTDVNMPIESVTVFHVFLPRIIWWKLERTLT